MASILIEKSTGVEPYPTPVDHHSPNTFMIAVLYICSLCSAHTFFSYYFFLNKPRRILPQGLCIHHRYSCNAIPFQDLLKCYFHMKLYSHTTLFFCFNFLKHHLYPCHENESHTNWKTKCLCTHAYTFWYRQ